MSDAIEVFFNFLSQLNQHNLYRLPFGSYQPVHEIKIMGELLIFGAGEVQRVEVQH